MKITRLHRLWEAYLLHAANFDKDHVHDDAESIEHILTPELEKKIRKIKDPELLRDWEYLQTSDHFYYICTKFFSDGSVHEYFSPYDTPYDAFINYMNVLSDFILRVEAVSKK